MKLKVGQVWVDNMDGPVTVVAIKEELDENSGELRPYAYVDREPARAGKPPRRTRIGITVDGVLKHFKLVDDLVPS